jgi:hypothetical protein
LNGDLARPLNIVAQLAPNTWAKCKRERRFTQGYSSRAWGGRGVKASGDTHDHGFALDIVTRGLSTYEVRVLVAAFQHAGFAAAFRVLGYNMGTARNPIINRTEHLHAAYQGESNYAALVRSTGPGGSANIERMARLRTA